MNINNLSSAEFEIFGTVLENIPASDNMISDLILIAADKPVKKLNCGFPIIIDYKEGMTALVIFDKSTELAFYIDRVVRLKPNITFALVPLEQSSKVTLIYEKNCIINTDGTVSSDLLKEVSPSLGFKNILTFFCQRTNGGFYFRGETHTPYEFIYVESGTLHTIVNGHDFVMDDGTCFLVGKNEWHVQYAESSVKFITISFFADETFISIVKDKIIIASDTVKTLIDRMLSEKNQQLLSKEYAESVFKIILIELIRNPSPVLFAEKYPSTRHAENLLVDKALRIIDNNIHTKISLTELAKELHISVPYLYELFSTHLHIPPGRYIARIRIEKSKLLLSEGNLTIGEIAHEVGFSSIQHFSKQFRNYCNMSPSEYVKSQLSERLRW